MGSKQHVFAYNSKACFNHSVVSPSNSVPEGTLSQMKHFWRDGKSNIDFWSFFAFQEFLEKDDALLREIRSNSKFDKLSKKQEYTEFSAFLQKELSDLYLEFEIIVRNDEMLFI
ncbi:hypothetical protein TYRP_019460 [Tyrophagus putrescentiae]|nr:hypothetical protein TYRP_019460 [Tyrophagus putrescentiae]